MDEGFPKVAAIKYILEVMKNQHLTRQIQPTKKSTRRINNIADNCYIPKLLDLLKIMRYMKYICTMAEFHILASYLPLKH